jgi:uncharacterized protein YneF (UPF0154 family)
MEQNTLVLIIIISIALFFIGYWLGERENGIIFNCTIRDLFSLKITIAATFIAAIIWSSGSVNNLLLYPLSSLFIGIIYGIFLSCISVCVYGTLPYALQPIVPILLFASIAYYLIKN